MAKYDFKKAEKKWRKSWEKEGIYEPDLKKAKKPFYNLMMFPYPSAEGLHVGNMYAFTGSDIYGRMKRMQGNDVFEPIGLDGFGIHSENYALKIGAHPMEQAKVSEKRFYQQLQTIGNGFAWSEKLETYNPDYYKWTQWIFLQLWKKGLAYRKKQPVNWCPSCKTVLADEQVIQKRQGTPNRFATGQASDKEQGITVGVCERCETSVIKKELEQWFFKITGYAERLLKNLDTLDWSEKVKIAQRNWIGKKEGINITYAVEGLKEVVTVFTTRPDTNFGATFVVLAPENELVLQIATPEQRAAVEKYVAQAKKKSEEERIAEGRKKTGVFTGRYALNHLTGKRMPVWVGDFVLSGFGTGAVVGVPGHDLRDFEFATEFDLEIVRVVKGSDGDVSPVIRAEQVQEEEGVMMNSGFLDGMHIHDATKAIMDHMEKKGWGKRVVQFRLRDWLISRQRYWGAPIPMIHCDACAKAGKGEQAGMPGWYAVPEKDLPVKLPYVENFRPTGTGTSPLALVEKFHKVKCPSCGKPARRETDVSDTFLDSAWYFLRYPSAADAKRPWDSSLTKEWLPVNMYIGGAEHSVLHLLYSRFVTMALHDMKLLHFEEPFTKFRAHGLLIKEGAKMSKSKGNVVNPDEYVKKFGADTLRMYLMFLAPFEQGGDFRDASILGVERFLKRVWKLFSNKEQGTRNKEQQELERMAHRAVKKVTEDIEDLHYNTAISQLMVLLNKMEEVNPPLSHVACPMFLKLLAPFAPFMTEEIWSYLASDSDEAPTGRRGRDRSKKFYSIHLAPWPIYDEKLIMEDTFTLVVQVGGKVRDVVEGVAMNISEEEAYALALSREKVRAFLGGKPPRRVVYIRGRIVNIVL